MKKLASWLKDIFDPQEFNDLDVGAIATALNDATVRTIWLANALEAVRDMNQEVDHRLLNGTEYGLTDLCARRKAYQDLLEGVLAAKRQAKQTVGHNPRVETTVNLDRVTA